MINPERAVVSSSERAPRTADRLVGQQAISAANQGERAKPRATYSPILEMADFADVYSPTKIQQDERYCARMRENFRDQKLVKEAERAGVSEEELVQIRGGSERVDRSLQFEKDVVRGIQVGRWLGNLPDQNGALPFTTRTYETTDFDDIVSRIDVFTTLKFREPLETDTGLEITQLPLGFDVTTNGTRQRVEEKLTKHYSHNAELPFGFSKLTYYTDGKQKGPLELVPRYVIGVGAGDMGAIQRSLQGTAPNLNAARVLETRFKILAEIRAENELYEAMLPDGAYESDDIRLRRAAGYIEATDAQLNRALDLCAQAMVEHKALPPTIREQLDDIPPQHRGKRRKLIEDYLLQKSHEDYLENQRQIHARLGTYYNQADDPADHPFVQIINSAHRLTAAAQDDDSPLQQRRKITTHNQPFYLDEQ